MRTAHWSGAWFCADGNATAEAVAATHVTGARTAVALLQVSVLHEVKPGGDWWIVGVGECNELRWESAAPIGGSRARFIRPGLVGS